VPVVRATGGLVDTIVDANDKNLAAGTATGFCFGEYSSFSLAEALERACKAFANWETWRRLMETGMRQDWSWAASARQYDELYRATARRARSGLVTDTA